MSQRGFEVEFTSLQQLNSKILSDFADRGDAFFLRDLGILSPELSELVQSFFTYTKTRVYPIPNQLDFTQDKYRTYLALKNVNARVIPTHFYLNAPLLVMDERLLAMADNEFVVKPIKSCKGIGVNYLHSQLDLNNFIETMFYQKNIQWMIQPRLKGVEYRAIYLGERLLAHFQKNSHHKGNLFQGAEFFKWSELNKDFDIQVTKLLSGDMLKNKAIAIDYIVQENSAYIIDVNQHFGIQALDETQRAHLWDYYHLQLHSE